MHAAPPVRVSVGASPQWAGAVAALAAVATANLCAWALAALREPTSTGPVLALAVLAAMVAGWQAWRRQGGGDLAWDGVCWQWRGAAGRVAVALDLDRWLLLCFQPITGGRCWIALERRRVAGPWAGVRAALYSLPGPDASDAATPA